MKIFIIINLIFQIHSSVSAEEKIISLEPKLDYSSLKYDFLKKEIVDEKNNSKNEVSDLNAEFGKYVDTYKKEIELKNLINQYSNKLIKFNENHEIDQLDFNKDSEITAFIEQIRVNENKSIQVISNHIKEKLTDKTTNKEFIKTYSIWKNSAKQRFNSIIPSEITSKNDLIKALQQVNADFNKLTNPSDELPLRKSVSQSSQEIKFMENDVVVFENSNSPNNRYPAIDNLLFSMYFRDQTYKFNKENISLLNLNAYKNSSNNENPCTDFSVNKNINFDKNDHIFLTLVNCFKIPAIQKSDIIKIAKIFCLSFNFTTYDEKFCSDLESKPYSQTTQKIVRELINSFGKLYIFEFQQTYKIGDKYIPIVDTTSLIIKQDKSDAKTILFKNIIKQSDTSLEEHFQKCVNNYPSNFINNCLITENSDISKFSFHPLRLSLNHYYQTNQNWKDCNISNLSLLKMYKDKDNKNIYHPIYDFNCTKGDSNDTVQLKIGAVTGLILKSVNEIINTTSNNDRSNINLFLGSKDNILFMPNNYSEGDISKSKIHIENIYNLVKLVVSPTSQNNKSGNLTNQISVYFEKSCKTRCKHQKGCGEPKTNTLCLGKNSKNENHAYNDKSIIAHEFAHLLTPIIVDHIKGKSINTKNNLSKIFHDLADSFAVIYSNDKQINSNNCIGYNIQNSNKGLETCIDKGDLTLPRKIDSNDSINNQIPLYWPSEYKRGEITSQMFNIALENELNYNENKKVVPYLQHWIRFIRSIMIFNYPVTPCKNCDLDFYIAQQNLMRSYAVQYINTKDEGKLYDLFYQWSINGYSNINSSCLSSITNPTNKCINNNSDPLFRYHGAAHGSISSAKGSNIINIKINSGVNYNIDAEKKLSRPQESFCNQVAKVDFIKPDGNSITIPIIDNNLNNNCLMEKEINIKNYPFFKNIIKFDEIRYKIETYKQGEEKSISTNYWYNKQPEQKIKILKKKEYNDIISSTNDDTGEDL